MTEYPSKKRLENYPSIKISDGPKYQHIPQIKYDPATISQEYSTKSRNRETYLKTITSDYSHFNQEYKRLNLYEICRAPGPRPLRRYGT